MAKKETGIYPMGPKKSMPGKHMMPGKMPMKDKDMPEMKKKKKKMMP